MKRSTWISVLATFFFAMPWMLSTSGNADAETVQPAVADVGAETCLSCHDKAPTNQMFTTPHAQKGDPRTPFATGGCETCHGSGVAHLGDKTKNEKPTIQFTANSPTPVAEQNGVCLGCHEGGSRIEWAGSQHHNADLACASCHNIHAAKDPMLVKTSQDDVCYECHVEQKAQSFRRSRHPIKEGKVACSDCHSPHGSVGPKLLKEATVNDTCYTCHAEKRGPFLWEHAPVQDDCSTCHTPHGSTQARLLKVRNPFLCQQCHQEAYHPSSLYSGSGIPPAGAAERLVASGCLNCHFKVHGSNHPSGVRFTR